MNNYTYLHPNSGYPVNCKVVDIYDLLDHKEAVLLPIAAGEKKPDIGKGWQKTQFEQTQTDEYQKKLESAFNNSAVGVLLGNGIYAIDVDNDELANQFLEFNPSLQKTLRTRGARGCQFWIKINDGDIPEFSVIELNGDEIGEWRPRGQSVIYGQHPSGPRYQVLTQEKPITIKFEEINWPTGWVGKFNQPDEPKAEPKAKAESSETGDKFDNGLGKRIAAYIEAIPGAIEGKGGHNQTLSVASALTNGFELSFPEAMPYMEMYNQKCVPPWSTKDLEHKVNESIKISHDKPRGHLLGLSIVLLPGRGRNESGFAKDISKKLPKEILFKKDDLIVEVSKPEDTGRTGLRFDVMTARKFTTWVEQFVTTGFLVELESGEKQFFENTMKDTQAAHALEGPTFGASLPRIDRILDVPIPVLVGSKVLYPEPGYNKSLKLYCDTTAPKIEEISVEEARRIILEEVYGEFCFKDEQSRSHAVARLITPYCRGIIGFQNRTPFWYFDANRPGAGKDYCNEVSQMVYLGHSAEDAPIGECSEETRKRITAALVSGRRMMHFANCQVHLSDQNFIQAITNSTLRVRMLGSTSATADLELANEIEFSISANIGLTCREDIERRCRRITLEYFEEHENSRQFKKPNLTQWVLENRGRILGAVHALVKAWLNAGSPKGKTPFTSFPEWSRVVGSIMEFHGLGDPCQPNVGGLLGGDLKSKAMSALYELAFEAGPDEWWTKQQMFSLIAQNQENDDRLDFLVIWTANYTEKRTEPKQGFFSRSSTGGT